MKRPAMNDQTITRYLLGEMSEDERMALEEKYFSEAGLYEQLEIAEGELIRRYVENELSPRERRLFEMRFLSRPWQREKAKLAQALKIYLAQQQAQKQAGAAALFERMAVWLRPFEIKPAFAWSMATAMVAMIFTGSWLFIQTQDLQTRLTQLETERLGSLQREQALRQQSEAQREQNNALAAQLQSEQNRRAEFENKINPPQRFSITLPLIQGASRSSEAAPQRHRLQIGPENQLVQLLLYAGSAAAYENFRVILETAAGDTILAQYRLAAQQTTKGRAVMVSLPANMLSADDYLVTLQGVLASREIEEVGHYYFNVTKK